MFNDASRCGAGVVYHDVNPAQCLMARHDEVLGITVPGEIGNDRDNLPARSRTDFFSCCGERILSARANGYVDAFASETERNGLANALTTTRNERLISFQS